jgi:hypothetical protein
LPSLAATQFLIVDGKSSPIDFMKKFIKVYKLDDDKVDFIKIRRAIKTYDRQIKPMIYKPF